MKYIKIYFYDEESDEEIEGKFVRYSKIEIISQNIYFQFQNEILANDYLIQELKTMRFIKKKLNSIRL
jgi:hypothetical protein